MMEYIDIGFIINTAIGTTIGTVFAAILLLPAFVQLLKQFLIWPGWKRMGTALSPLFVAALFAIGFMGMAAYSSERLRVGRQPLYRFSCQNECREEEEVAAQACAELSVLYANPKRRGEIATRNDLREIFPDNAPRPRRNRLNQWRYSTGLAKDTFEACMMEKKGYTIQSCTEQETCYRVHIDERITPRSRWIDYRNVDLVETVDPVVAE